MIEGQRHSDGETESQMEREGDTYKDTERPLTVRRIESRIVRDREVYSL